jgi:hypothetical protein
MGELDCFFDVVRDKKSRFLFALPDCAQTSVMNASYGTASLGEEKFFRDNSINFP